MQQNSTLHITSPPDPAKMMKFVSENPTLMPMMAEAFEETIKSMAKANPSTREKMIENHMEQVRAMREWAIQHCSFTAMTHSYSRKSEQALGPRQELCPIAVSSLTMRTTHRGRVLRGTLVVPPYTMTATASILEDAAGDVVRVAFYNVIPEIVPQAKKQAHGEALFPKGTMVAISEPFYKIAADGGPLVRVDNPRDVRTITSLSPCSAEDWKREGNLFFRSALFDDAVRCYSRALNALCQQAAILPLLLNISNAFFRLQDHARSLLFALVARAVSDGGESPASSAAHAKAQYRLGLALASSYDLLLHSEHARAPADMFCAGAAWFKKESERVGMDAKSLELVVDSLAGAVGHSALTQSEQSASERDLVELLSALPCATAIHAPPSSSECSAAAAEPEAARRMTPTELKEHGNALFREDKLSEALAVYRAALRVELGSDGGVQELLAALLCNRSMCRTRLGDHASAYLDATAAVAVQPARAKAHYHRCSALVELGLSGAAQASCELALKACRADDKAAATVEALAELQARIQILQSSKVSAESEQPAVEAESASGGGAVRLSEREFQGMARDAAASLEQITGLNQLLSLLPGAGGLALDARIPDLPAEFATHGTWPDHDPGQVRQYSLALSKAFEQARALPLLELQFRRLPSSLPPPPIPDIDIMKRLGGMSREGLEWWKHARIGSLRARHAEAGGYSSKMQHSFSNAPHLQLPLRFGSCHVAVGFVDLGALLFCDLVEPSASERWDGRSLGAPVEWVGYEQSAYSVAKTLVILDMLKTCQGDGDVDSILQVWFSSSWSSKAAAAFRRAVARVLQDASPGGSKVERVNCEAAAQREVHFILQHWLQQQVPLQAARAEWLASHDDLNAASCCQLVDRLALTRYELSGELPGLAQAAVGSTVMFGLPADVGHMALGESVFHFIPLEALLLYRTGAQHSPCPADAGHGLPGYRPRKALPAADVVAAAVELLRDGVSHLASAVSKSRLHVGVRLATVGLDDERALEEIKTMKPRTMTWSNVPDYWESGEVMEVLQRCSTAGTEHFLYSMNWPLRVKGASVIDLQHLSSKSGALEHGRRLMAEHWARDGSHPSRGHLGGCSGSATELFLCPPPTNPYNIADWYIACANQHEVCRRFLQYVVSPAAGTAIAGGEPVPPRCQKTPGEATLQGPWLLSNPFRNGVYRSQHCLEAAGIDEWTALSYNPLHRSHNLLAFSLRATAGLVG